MIIARGGVETLPAAPTNLRASFSKGSLGRVIDCGDCSQPFLWLVCSSEPQRE